MIYQIKQQKHRSCKYQQLSPWSCKINLCCCGNHFSNVLSGWEEIFTREENSADTSFSCFEIIVADKTFLCVQPLSDMCFQGAKSYLQLISSIPQSFFFHLFSLPLFVHPSVFSLLSLLCGLFPAIQLKSTLVIRSIGKHRAHRWLMVLKMKSGAYSIFQDAPWLNIINCILIF